METPHDVPASDQERTPRVTLTRRQKAALGVVLAEPSLEKGLKVAGIGRSTWWAWKRQPAFQAAIKRAGEQLLDEGLDRFNSGFLRAVEVLWDLTSSKSEGVRLQACTVFMNQALKAIETKDLRARVKALEERLTETPRSKPTAEGATRSA
jgi:hypothetical protein